jgi:hypothetical protein
MDIRQFIREFGQREYPAYQWMATQPDIQTAWDSAPSGWLLLHFVQDVQQVVQFEADSRLWQKIALETASFVRMNSVPSLLVGKHFQRELDLAIRKFSGEDVELSPSQKRSLTFASTPDHCLHYAVECVRQPGMALMLAQLCLSLGDWQISESVRMETANIVRTNIPYATFEAWFNMPPVQEKTYAD